jgi:hypothetical protein
VAYNFHFASKISNRPGQLFLVLFMTILAFDSLLQFPVTDREMLGVVLFWVLCFLQHLVLQLLIDCSKRSNK